MIIARFDDYTLIMVHIPKAAGSSLCLTLRRYRQSGQSWNEYLQIDEGVDQTHSALYYPYLRPHLPIKTEGGSTTEQRKTRVLISVRNPYDRLYSAYRFSQRTQHFRRRGIDRHPRIAWFAKPFSVVVKRCLTHWVKCYTQAVNRLQTLEPVGIHFCPMWCFVTDQHKRIRADHILRQERLEADFARFCHELGWSSSSVIVSRSTTPREPAPAYAYLRQYDRQMIELVNRLYKKDFELFGYTMLDPERFPETLSTS